MSKELIEFIQDLYDTKDFIPLHEPLFDQRDTENLIKTVESTFVSSVGPMVEEFESKICDFTGSKYAIAVMNGTAALHIAMLLSNVNPNDEVITQSFNFVASVNAIHQSNAVPVFVDIDKDSLGMCPKSLLYFLESNCEIRDDGFCWNKTSNRIIKACMPMHTFGLPCDLDNLNKICKKFNLNLVEDAAESLGSFYKSKHTGTIGDVGILSFNGNKIITTGGGGMILTNDSKKAAFAKHITTTAKLDKKWFFEHDRIAYNYRMPNINASLGVSQIDKLPRFLEAKRFIAEKYLEYSKFSNMKFVSEPEDSKSNYWLNTFITEDINQRNEILESTNQSKVMTRAGWNPMHTLKFNKKYQTSSLENTDWLFDRVINVPSSVKGTLYEKI